MTCEASGNAVVIRTLSPDDLPTCVNVIRSSFRTVADELGFTPENAPRFTAFSVTEEKLRGQFEDERRLMLGAFADSRELIGCCSLLFQDPNECELNCLCVLPAYRHNGIGEALLDGACARARETGCVRMNLSIVEENRPLRRWYERHGFTHTGTRKFDFFPFTCGYMTRAL